jgi:hypothetical protein
LLFAAIVVAPETFTPSEAVFPVPVALYVVEETVTSALVPVLIVTLGPTVAKSANDVLDVDWSVRTAAPFAVVQTHAVLFQTKIVLVSVS